MARLWGDRRDSAGGLGAPSQRMGLGINVLIPSFYACLYPCEIFVVCSFLYYNNWKYMNTNSASKCILCFIAVVSCYTAISMAEKRVVLEIRYCVPARIAIRNISKSNFRLTNNNLTTQFNLDDCPCQKTSTLIITPQSVQWPVAALAFTSVQTTHLMITYILSSATVVKYGKEELISLLC